MTFVDFYNWVGDRTFKHWPGWLSETVGGVLLTLALAATFTWLPVWLAAGLWATALSGVYERWVDPNGWSWLDVGLRQPAIVVMAALWAFFG